MAARNSVGQLVLWVCSWEGLAGSPAMAEGERSPLGRVDCSAAARGEHIAVLQWAQCQGCPWITQLSATRNAAVSGHQALLKWAREQGMSKFVEKETCAEAAYAGQMATLQWMRKHGWDWDLRVCSYAAWGGHLAVLQ